MLTHERQDYAQARQWTNYLTLDPVRLVQNILGGGEVQRDRLAIASLELEAANLIRRREEVAEALAGEVVGLVLDHEEMLRKGDLLSAQVETQRLRQAVAESSYRTGQSSTDAMLRVWQRTEELEASCEENLVDDIQTLRELSLLVADDSDSGYGPAVNYELCAWHSPVPVNQTTVTIGDE